MKKITKHQYLHGFQIGLILCFIGLNLYWILTEFNILFFGCSILTLALSHFIHRYRFDLELSDKESAIKSKWDFLNRRNKRKFLYKHGIKKHIKRR